MGYLNGLWLNWGEDGGCSGVGEAVVMVVDFPAEEKEAERGRRRGAGRRLRQWRRWAAGEGAPVMGVWVRR